MVASVESWDGCTTQRKMTIEENCQKGSLAGVATFRQYSLQDIGNYRSIITTVIGWASIVYIICVITRSNWFLWNTCFFLIASLGVILVSYIRCARHNYHYGKQYRDVHNNELSHVVGSVREWNKFFDNPSPAVIHSFRGKNRYGYINGNYHNSANLSVINLSDGDGFQIVFIEFLDDCDRVMFRLLQ